MTLGFRRGLSNQPHCDLWTQSVLERGAGQNRNFMNGIFHAFVSHQPSPSRDPDDAQVWVASHQSSSVTHMSIMSCHSRADIWCTFWLALPLDPRKTPRRKGWGAELRGKRAGGNNVQIEKAIYFK
jgi:hypothetical protein